MIFTGKIDPNSLFTALGRQPGGYYYSGVASEQICFPLKSGGELRFMMSEEDPPDVISIDHYDGALPPGITGPVFKTGEKK